MHGSNRTFRFLLVSMIVIFVVCIGIFVFLGVHMSKQNETTMNYVGSLYMASMNERISKHFSTMVDMRMTQLDTLVESIPFDRNVDGEELREYLIDNAQIRGFESLAYFYDDGSYELLYGESIRLLDPDLFYQSMRDRERNVCVGVNDAGTQFAVVGVPFTVQTEYTDKACIGLVGRMPIDYISDTLSLNDENSLVYSFVLRKDGTFVIHSADAYRHNYFDRVREVYDKVVGMEKEEYIQKLQEAMQEDRDFSIMFVMNGDRRQMYCSKLPNSQWYLLTFMPYGAMNEVVEQMGKQSFYVAILCCSIILVMLLLVFLYYFRMSRAQMKELEEARSAAVTASRSKSEFLSNMSHDIRTPMNAIIGMTSIAMANIDNQARVQNCLRKIVLSSKHLLGLINDVLDMSKIESGKMTLNVDLVSLREVLDSIVSIVQPQMKAKQQNFNIFIYDISSENVLCDSVRLNQVLLNLLSNAIKFTPEGGSIEVSLHEKESPRGADYVRIVLRVKDTGIGMSKEFQEHIFDSFAREDSKRVQKTEGTGLGMAITKYIVDAMGGEIEVHSTQDVGTEFLVTLDFQHTDDREEEMILPHFTMLVVDDNQQLCESTVSSLDAIGVQAEWTLDGESAVELARQRHQKHHDFQVILLDWKLPGMDGIKTARILRMELGNEVPILLLSAYDCSDIEEEARAAGITGFLSKPLFKSTLYYGLKPYVNVCAEVSAKAEQAADVAGMRVLLAEDNDLNAEIAQELLQDEGLTVDWAENGQVCVNRFTESPVGYYDAILMDLRMPVMNGYEATKAIRTMQDRPDADLPIIAMTADAFSDDVQRCMEHGMNAHVAKPIDIREITRLLSRFVRKKDTHH